jgi:hypothetical protein
MSFNDQCISQGHADTCATHAEVLICCISEDHQKDIHQRIPPQAMQPVLWLTCASCQHRSAMSYLYVGPDVCVVIDAAHLQVAR